MRTIIRSNLLVFIMLFIILIIPARSFAEAKNTELIISEEFLESGFISVTNGTSEPVKILIKKDNEKYYYNIQKKSAEINLPLQMGNGNYTIKVYVKKGDNYTCTKEKTINLNLANENTVYLNSIQLIDFEKEGFIENISEIFDDTLERNEKIEEIYEYIKNKYRYDRRKFRKLSNNYIPDPLEILDTNRGICYDFSSLFAAILRSENIECKLVMGYTENTDVFHAWNEVYYPETETWEIIDLSYDIQMKLKSTDLEMFKDISDYSKTSEY
jgi:hypothetical protein